MKDVVAQQRFRRLYEAACRPVLAYALRRTRSTEDASDVLIETFTIARVHLGEVPQGDTAVLLLYATARGPPPTRPSANSATPKSYSVPLTSS